MRLGRCGVLKAAGVLVPTYPGRRVCRCREGECTRGRGREGEEGTV